MKTILLIEDNLEILDNLKEFLEMENYCTHSATCGKSGVKLAKNHQPDLIISDILLSDWDGFKVLKKLSKMDETKNIPFIFCSAQSEPKIIKKGMKLGAVAYVIKPFDLDVLLETIKTHLDLNESGSRTNSVGLCSLLYPVTPLLYAGLSSNSGSFEGFQSYF